MYSKKWYGVIEALCKNGKNTHMSYSNHIQGNLNNPSKKCC